MRSVAAAIIFVVLTSSSFAATVSSRSGIHIRVAPHAAGKLQCVVNYVESRGVHITSMRGYGRGTVRGSLHPSGQAIDINQYARNRTRPRVPAGVSIAAASSCGVISGASWRYADNGHWNLGVHYASHRSRVRYARRRAPVYSELLGVR